MTLKLTQEIASYGGQTIYTCVCRITTTPSHGLKLTTAQNVRLNKLLKKVIQLSQTFIITTYNIKINYNDPVKIKFQF